VEDRKPSAAFWIEAARRNGAELASVCPPSVFRIDLEQQVDAWLKLRFNRLVTDEPSPSPRRPAEQAREDLSEGLGPTRPKPRYLLQMPVVCRKLELLERLDPKLVVNPVRQFFTNTWNAGEQIFR
jgi:hypothetical protein